jgi:hypothetical protein
MDIKVSVEYETPKTDKFAALMAQYNEVKQIAADTVSYYKPLAEAAEAAKFDAIWKQLSTIFEYLRQLNRIGSVYNKVYGCFGRDAKCFSVAIEHCVPVVKWGNTTFSKEAVTKQPRLFNADASEYYNILGNWDKWRVYEKLESECIRLLEFELKRQKDAAEAQVKRLHNITGG